MKNQGGFTLIELVVVIVILGILAAVAVPKFIDIQTDAEIAAAKGVYGGAQSATALNHAEKLVKGTAWTGTLITTGTSLLAAMEETPDGWQADDAGANKGICKSPTTAGDCATATYQIAITTDETATVKAKLTKVGF